MSVTLADIERAVARRVGPFYLAFADRQSPSTAKLDTVIVPTLRSSIEQDVVPNLWLLRRGEPLITPTYRGVWNELGVYNPDESVDYLDVRYYTRVQIVGTTGQLPPPSDTHWNLYTTPYVSVEVSDYDRQRQVAYLDPGRGAATVDRPWQVAPSPGEVLEFHHLDPVLELREAVRSGLRRCLFEDRFNLGQGYFFESDLTAALPWLDDLNMIKRVQTSPLVGGLGATGPSDIPYVVFGECGHVWLRVGGSGGTAYYGGLLVTVHRPHFGWVNGADTCDGPREDSDSLNVPIDFATAAAHIEAWHLFPRALQAAAAGNIQASREQAAYEYTRQAYVHRLPRHDRQHFESGFRGWSVVVNA